MTSLEAAFASAPVKPGDVIAGKYRVEVVLGLGSMSVVVRAFHLQLHAPVAIKFLVPQVAKHPEALERFLREARATVQIHSEHVARVLDVDTLEQGVPYMVIEYLEGRDLADLLDSDGALPRERAVGFILQACEGLAEAHAAGITHRDLKPANLFVTQRHDGTPSLKVLDFGISKLRDGSSASSMTNADVLMGSPLYMSPEQFVSARDVDARSDIWSLGVVLYELLSGNAPFVADSLPSLYQKIVNDPPLPLGHGPERPPGLVRIIERCLCKNPDERYATVGELARDLAEFGPDWAQTSVAGTTIHAPRRPGASTALQREHRATLSGLANTHEAPARHPRRRVTVACGLVALLPAAVLVFHAMTRGPPPHAWHPTASAGPGADPAARPTEERAAPIVSIVTAPSDPDASPGPTQASRPVIARVAVSKKDWGRSAGTPRGLKARSTRGAQRRSLEELAEDRR